MCKFMEEERLRSRPFRNAAEKITEYLTEPGLPTSAIAPMLATDIFFGAIRTAFNQVSVQFALIQQGGQMSLLNVDALRSCVLPKRT